MIKSLEQAVAWYMAEYGEPGYRYSKKRVLWSKSRRQQGYHSIPSGDGEEVSKEEYEENIAASNKFVTEAFMCRLQISYWRYDKKLSKDGWREVLLRDIDILVPR